MMRPLFDTLGQALYTYVGGIEKATESGCVIIENAFPIFYVQYIYLYTCLYA